MTVTTEANGQIVKAKPRDLMADLIASMIPEMERALPGNMNPHRMARIVLSAVRMKPDLAKSDKWSFLGCMMALAQLGLEPDTPLQHAWLIPRNSKKRGMETTIQIGYQGYVELAFRAGTVIDTCSVYPEDEFEYFRGTDPRIIHKPDPAGRRTDADKITHVYAVGFPRQGRPLFAVLTRAQVEKRRALSARGTKPDSPWVLHWQRMAEKSAIRALYRVLPKSAEMAQVAKIDDAHDLGKSILTAIDDGPAAEVLEQMGADLGDDGEGGEA